MLKYIKLRKSLYSKSKRSTSSPPRSIPHDRDTDDVIPTQLVCSKAYYDSFATMSVNLLAKFSSMFDRYQSRDTNISYPISTLPEHLHSTSLSYAETTLNSRKLVSFPLIAHYLSAGPPLPPTPPFTGRPGHTHT